MNRTQPTQRRVTAGIVAVRLLFCLCVALAATFGNSASAQQPIAIDDIKRETAVGFQQDIVPILRKNCLACHSAAEKQGGLVLETPADMLRGGDSGPAIAAGNSKDSLLLQLASHQQEPFMPPPKNEVAAANLSSQELGLLKLWIDQGAQAGDIAALSPKSWQPLPKGVNPILATAVSPDGQFAACSRANQIFIYHVPTGTLVTRLTDPALQSSGDGRPGVAHLDLVQSLTFNGDGDLLASGSFREVKLWRRPRDIRRQQLAAGAGVTSLAVTSDGNWLATATEDHSIRIWNPQSGEASVTLSGHTDKITDLLFFDQQRLVSVSLDQTLRVWNRESGELVAMIEAPSPLHAVTAIDGTPASDGTVSRWLITGGADNQIRLWSIPERAPRSIAEAPAELTHWIASMDGRWLAGADKSGTVRVLDVGNFAVVGTWKAVDGPLDHLLFAGTQSSSDASAPPLVATAVGGSIQWWNASTSERVDQVQIALTPLRSLAISQDATLLAAGFENGQAAVWKRTSELQPLNLTDLNCSGPWAISTSRKKLAVVTTSSERPAIDVIDLENGTRTHHWLGHEQAIQSISFSADESRVISGSADGSVRVWDLQDAKFPEVMRLDFGSPVSTVAIRGDAQQIVAGGSDGSVRLWNVADGQVIQQFAGNTAAVVHVGFLGNDAYSVAADKGVRFWNAGNGQVARQFADPAVPTAATASADGQRLAIAGDDHQVRIYETASGRLLTTLPTPAAMTSLHFHADATRLSGVADGAWVAWDVAQSVTLEVQPHAGVLAAIFETHGDKLLLLDSERLARNTLRFQRLLAGMTQPVTDLQFHADNQLLFAANQDGNLRGYRVSDGQAVYTAGTGSPINDLAISVNSSLLATAGENGQVRIWNAANGGAAGQPPAALPSPVQRVVFAAEDTRVVAAVVGEAPLQVVYDIAGGGVIQQFRQPADVALAATKREIFSASAAGLEQWSLEAGRVVPGHGQPVSALAAVPATPQQVFSGSLDGTVRRWNLDNGQQLQQFNHGAPVTAIAVRPDGQRLAAAGNNHVARLWNTQNGQQVAEMRGDLRARAVVTRLTQQQQTAQARQNAAKQRVDTAEKDLPVKTETHTKATETLTAANKDVEAKTAMVKTTMEAKIAQEKAAIEAAAAAKQALLAKQQADQRAAEATLLAQRTRERATRLAAAAQSAPNDQDLAAAATAAQKLADEMAAKAQQATAEQQAPAKAAEDAAKTAADVAAKVADVQKPYNDAVAALRQAEMVQNLAAQTQAITMRELAAAEAEVPKAKEALTAADALVEQIKQQLETANQKATAAEQPLTGMAYSPDGRLLATCGDFPSAHTWDGESGLPVAAYAGHNGPLRDVVFASAESLVSASGDQSAVIWEVNPEWRLERTLGAVDDASLFAHRVMSVDFSRDGSLLATGGGVPSRRGEVHVFQVVDGKLVLHIPEAHDDAVYCVRMSPDGRRVASAGADKYVRTFDAGTGELLRRFEGHTGYVLGLSWKSDAELLASCSDDMTVKVWNPETGDQVQTISNFNKSVTCVQFIGDTDNVVSSCGDRVARMHNARNAGNFRNFSGATGYLHALDITANGEVLVVGGHDSVLRIWNGNNNQLRHAIEAPSDQ